MEPRVREPAVRLVSVLAKGQDDGGVWFQLWKERRGPSPTALGGGGAGGEALNLPLSRPRPAPALALVPFPAEPEPEPEPGQETRQETT